MCSADGAEQCGVTGVCTSLVRSEIERRMRRAGRAARATGMHTVWIADDTGRLLCACLALLAPSAHEPTTVHYTLWTTDSHITSTNVCVGVGGWALHPHTTVWYAAWIQPPCSDPPARQQPHHRHPHISALPCSAPTVCSWRLEAEQAELTAPRHASAVRGDMPAGVTVGEEQVGRVARAAHRAIEHVCHLFWSVVEQLHVHPKNCQTASR